MSSTVSHTIVRTAVAPSIVRTTNKLGDYLSQPDLAKFELPKKMSRPWIVNNAYEQEKLKEMMETQQPVEKHKVVMQIRDKKKVVGINKKNVKNINEIIAKDCKSTLGGNTGTNLNNSRNMNKRVQPKKAGKPQHDATPRSNVVGAPIASRQEDDETMDEKRKNLARDIELEQQQLMNRLYNSPEAFSTSSSPPPFLPGQMMPVMVANPAGGYYIVHLPLQPLPASLLPFKSSSTSSSLSPPSSEDGSVAGDESDTLESSDDTDDSLESLVDTLKHKLDISSSSLSSSASEAESDEGYRLEEDEELNRLVLSIIDDDE